jgi:antitoxin (DNA-binding transcriptional repressor) of toxin-antitoxin stability system
MLAGHSRLVWLKVKPETVKKVKLGDLVTITYSEALAASIVPVSTK